MYVTRRNVGAVLLLIHCLLAVGCETASKARTEVTVPAVRAPDGSTESEFTHFESDPPKTLAVTIKPRRDRVRSDEIFRVDAHVLNTSQTPQSFEVMTCSWGDNWRSNNAQIDWLHPVCHGNYPETVTLQPGEAYEQTLVTIHRKSAKREKVAFRVGFTPIDSKQTYWSNEVSLAIDPAAEPISSPRE